MLVNAALEGMTGYKRDGILKLEFFQTFITLTGQVAEHAKRECGRAAPGSYDITITRADGATRKWELAASRIVFRGAPASIVSAFDVTDRWLSEEALRESEARFRAVVNSAAVGIVIFDGQNVVQANPAAAKMFGVEEAGLSSRIPGSLTYRARDA